MNQNRALRKRWLIDDFIHHKKFKGAYWGVASDINKFTKKKSDLEEQRKEDKKIVAMVKDNEATRDLKNIRTRLNRFTEEEQGRLINWGYALTDIAMRLHVLPKDPGPGSWPIEKYRLDR